MLCGNKQILHQNVSLFNEKLLFKSDTVGLSRFSDMFIRSYFTINSYPDIDAILYAQSSRCMILPKIKMDTFRNTRRFMTKCTTYKENALIVFPYLFFSYIHNYLNARHAFLMPSRRQVHLKYNNSLGLSFGCCSVSYIGYFDDYFYGIVDADLKYNINVTYQLGVKFNNQILIRLFSSLFCIPFTNYMKYAH